MKEDTRRWKDSCPHAHGSVGLTVTMATQGKQYANSMTSLSKFKHNSLQFLKSQLIKGQNHGILKQPSIIKECCGITIIGLNYDIVKETDTMNNVLTISWLMTKT